MADANREKTNNCRLILVWRGNPCWLLRSPTCHWGRGRMWPPAVLPGSVSPVWWSFPPCLPFAPSTTTTDGGTVIAQTHLGVEKGNSSVPLSGLAAAVYSCLQTWSDLCGPCLSLPPAHWCATPLRPYAPSFGPDQQSVGPPHPEAHWPSQTQVLIPPRDSVNRLRPAAQKTQTGDQVNDLCGLRVYVFTELMLTVNDLTHNETHTESLPLLTWWTLTLPLVLGVFSELWLTSLVPSASPLLWLLCSLR